MKVAVWRCPVAYDSIRYNNFRIPEKLVKKLNWFCEYFKETPFDQYERCDPELIKTLEEMKQNGENIGYITIVDIPDNINWIILKDSFNNEYIEEVIDVIPRRW